LCGRAFSPADEGAFPVDEYSSIGIFEVAVFLAGEDADAPDEAANSNSPFKIFPLTMNVHR
jgi:hypothetical protein